MPERKPFTNIYDLEYFTGSTTFLYIGDVLIDEVVSLQYSIQQAKQPIFGYASQLFDTVAAGQVYVQGSFAINYKEQGYLWAVLRRYFKISEAASKLSFLKDRNNRRLSSSEKARKRRDESLLLGKGNPASPVVGSNGTQVSRASIERIVRGDATRSERYSFYEELAGYATFDVDSPKDKVFEDIVEVFEDQVWLPSVTNDDLNTQLRRTDDNLFDGFDMYIVFGDYSNPRANHSVAKITGVHLITRGTAVSLDTSPVMEEYSFIARSVV